MKKTKMHYYTCEACHYTFASDGHHEYCTDCGKFNLRYATKLEIEDFYRIKWEIENGARTEWELLLNRLSA